MTDEQIKRRSKNRRTVTIFFAFVAIALIFVYFSWHEIFLSMLYSAYGLSHVRLVDELPNGSLVFRTGLPMISLFNYLWLDFGKLKTELRRAKKDRGLHIGLAKKGASTEWTEEMEKMPIVDMSLLTRELYAISVEKQFFEKLGKPNEFIHLPTYGVRSDQFSLLCDIPECKNRQPRDLDETRRHELAAYFDVWDSDQTVERMKRVTDMVSTGPPRIYFFHCVCGCDRTGAFFIQYSMTRNSTSSFVKLLQESIATSGRALYYNYQVSAQWYCEYLRTIGVYSRNDCGACDGKQFRCKDTGIPFDQLFFDQCLNVAGTVFVAVLIFLGLADLLAGCVQGRKGKIYMMFKPSSTDSSLRVPLV